MGTDPFSLEVDETMLMLDSTTVKVHQHTSGAKKGIPIPRRNRTEPGRFNSKGSCGNGWVWESIALCILQREPQ